MESKAVCCCVLLGSSAPYMWKLCSDCCVIVLLVELECVIDIYDAHYLEYGFYDAHYLEYGSFNCCRAVSDVLTNLKGIATEMGSELDRQNGQVDRLGNKMDANQVHLDRARKRVNNQLWAVKEFPVLLSYCIKYVVSCGV